MTGISMAADYYHDCRDWLRIDLDRKMPSYHGCTNYSPDLIRVNAIKDHYGFTEAMLAKAVNLGVITEPRKYRNRDTHRNLYDANEISLRANQIEALRSKA